MTVHNPRPLGLDNPAHPEATTFLIMGPVRLLGDEDRQDALCEHLATMFPGNRFSIVGGVVDADTGRRSVISELAVMPLLGELSDNDSGRASYRRRPSAERISEIHEAMTRFLAGARALN